MLQLTVSESSSSHTVHRHSDTMQDVAATEGKGNVRPLQVQNSRGRPRQVTLGSADWQELLHSSSLGEGSSQELLGQGSGAAGCPSLGQGAHPGGKSVHEQPELGLEPSPLMRWTSDGSMMEELLKTFTPGTPTAAATPVSQSLTALGKEVSISSALLALIAEQEEENVAAESHSSAGVLAISSRGGVGMQSPKAPLNVKVEGDMKRLLSTRQQPGTPDVAVRAAGCSSGTGARGYGQDTAIMDGQGPAPPVLLPTNSYLHCEAAPPASLVAIHASRGDSSACTRKVSDPQLQRSRQTEAGYSPTGAEVLSGQGRPRHSEPQQLPGVTLQCVQEVHNSRVRSSTGNASPSSLRPLSAPGYSGYLPTGRTCRPLSAPLQQQQALAMGHIQRPARLLLEGPAPTAGGSVRTFHAPPALDVGTQLAAEFMREAASLHTNAVYAGRLLGPSAQAFVREPRGHTRPLFVAAPAAEADADAEPPAVLTAGISTQGQLLGDGAQRGATHELGGQSPGPPALMDVEPLRGKRERGSPLERPPAGPKRSAVGPPPARAVSTEPDDEEDSDGGSSRADRGHGAGGASAAAGYIDEREAKRQLRKEKNRASAAASRARREAYTASLEEEVAKLKEGQDWLERQVNAPEVVVAMPMATSAPVRHLSI